MDFFERQRQAKKKTGILVFLFCVAVLLISLLNFLIIAVTIPLARRERNKGDFDFSTFQDPMLALWVVLGTFVIICLAGLYRKTQLDGGSSIASMMGGRLVNMASTDADEQKLMNVVEEMAIASSVPMPEVYVMDGEKGINAFAAGYTVDDAVIGVTDGCMRRLQRDELQGVIAHEFSHILNQDMRLNFRLIAVVFGLLVLAQLGRLMMRIGFNSSGRRSRSSSNEGGGAALIGIAGLGIMASGGLGILMGNLIKSAVSRQREYLADSSAVQFTRNPEGLSGALKKIGALSSGSRLVSPHADEASHMFFGNGMRESWFSITATHPPLLERIQLLEPSFDGDFSEVQFEERPSPSIEAAASSRGKQAGIPIPGVGDALGQALPPVVMGLAAAGQARVEVGSADAVSGSVGNPTQQHIDFAAALLQSLPKPVREAAREPHDACALVFALLLDKQDEAVRTKQLGQVEDLFGETMAKATLKLSGEVAQLDPRAKLPVADLAIGALRRLAREQFDYFTHLLESLAAADEQIDLFEFSLSKLVIRHLEPHFLKQRNKTAQLYSLKRAGRECSILVSALACTAGSDDETIQKAQQAGAACLADATEVIPLPPAECGLNELDQALVTLAGASPNLKRQLIQAAAATVSADGYLQIKEAELLRAVADSLDCPMPPLAIALDTAA